MSQIISLRIAGNKHSFRASDNDDELINNFLKNIKVNKSQLLRYSLNHYIKLIKKKDKKTLKECGKMIRQFKIEQIRKEQKEEYYQLYIIKNTINRVYEYAKSTWINTGEINMDIIKHIIDNAIKLEKTFDPKIRKKLKKEMISLKGLKDQQYLETKLSLIKGLVDDVDEKKAIKKLNKLTGENQIG